MKIALAQFNPERGNIPHNIQQHKKQIDRAVAKGAEVIIFPELSLTGYHPDLADKLAVDKDDPRFDDFQRISDHTKITIGVGVPLEQNEGVVIGMMLFQPYQERKVYAKKYLHADEEPYFVRGENFPVLRIKDVNMALAICYELSVPEHIEEAMKNQAQVYIASVAKVDRNINKCMDRLSHIAKQYSIPVLMSNGLGSCDGSEGIGRTSVWNKNGILTDQLDDEHEGILIVDTDTLRVYKEIADNEVESAR